ncbi:cytochrome c biogenesis protein CcdA [Hyphomicrobium sp. 99]|uniref:cytochrome c biogenesis protein CcdA n=1 Tax=Hyphomicrobium sp. 99 TaxID=1163419 RepID=UPI00273A0FB2|nr:cytochrome c biogenesis protein CcdA [Hyphomicrobium sp. 99]
MSEPQQIPDATVFAASWKSGAKLALLATSLLVGAEVGVTTGSNVTDPQTMFALFVPFAVAGGLLSTWSPCGYSSICLLRPNGRWSARSVARWMPTLASHALGYFLGALVIGGVLGVVGYLFGLDRALHYTLPVYALLLVAYGAHQFGFLRVPYPQRRSQVPHDARQRFPKWVIGLLYGFSLGLNYCTYVQTPLLYAVTALALLIGSPKLAIGLFLAFNLGRFLPVALNALPISDVRITSWLARNQENAVIVDGALLCGLGAYLAASLFF